MTRTGLAFRSARFYWRSSLAIGFGVALGAAILTGALLIGDSMRGSLRESSLARLGPITHALQAPRMITLATASRVRSALDAGNASAAPLLLMPASLSTASGDARVNHAQLIGFDELVLRAWRSDSSGAASDDLLQLGTLANSARGIALNAALAAELDASVGQDVIVRAARVSPISFDSILGRRSDTTVSARLTVAAIVSNDGIGGLALRPAQARPLNAFIPRAALADLIEQPDRVNTIAFVAPAEAGEPNAAAASLRHALSSSIRVDDYGIKILVDAQRSLLTVESDGLLLDPALEEAVWRAAEDLRQPAVGVITYLANTIRNERSGRETPYSTVTALGPGLDDVFLPLFEAEEVRQPAEPPGPATREAAPPIILSQWLADDLEAEIGDTISLEYDVVDAQGALAGAKAAFRVIAIAPVNATTADPGFAPTFPGVTDSDQMSDWDPPFPVRLDRVRDKDELWWDQHRAAPKAFISLGVGKRLWGEADARIGTLTSIRMRPESGQTAAVLADALRRAVPDIIAPQRLGLRVTPVRHLALKSSQGSTDFSGLFIGFSLFLVASAAMLVMLLARLGVERRAAEIGLLTAVGFTSGAARGVLLREHALIAVCGAAVGAPLGLAYAAALLAGLQSWWADAVAGATLHLHVQPLSVVIGFASAVMISVSAAAWTISSICRKSPRALLAGQVESTRRRGSSRAPVIVAILASIGAAALIAMAAWNRIPATAGFFGGGALALIACLSGWRVVLGRHQARPPSAPGLAAQLRFGADATPRQPGRSLLTASLIACATFLIVSLGAFHLDPADVTNRDGGAGGFALFAESATPLPIDPTSPDAASALSLSDAARKALTENEAFAFRLRPGGSASCLNLYVPDEPRLLGAPAAFLQRGGFSFGATMFPGESWKSLERVFDDGAIPVIGDEAAVQWQLHKALGEDLVIHDSAGVERRLRFVALLSGSLLQDELIISESAFRKLFPRVEGYGFLLIAAAPAETEALTKTLEAALADYGLDVGDSARRMRDYFSVQNTYLSTFQTLGGFGLALGVVGLAIVMLRHVVERRGELALLRAIGFPDDALALALLAEHALVILVGLLCGLGPALLAIAPVALTRPTAIPWGALAGTLAVVAISGAASLAIAARRATRAQIVPALRSE